jgi:hypothetical protein
MFFTTFKQSLANQKLSSRAIPSLHTMDSIAFGSTMPQWTNTEAPIKHPSSSLAISAMDTFLDKVASTWILTTPEGVRSMPAAVHAPEPMAAAHAPPLQSLTQAYPQNYALTEDFDKHSHESPFAVHTK